MEFKFLDDPGMDKIKPSIDALVVLAREYGRVMNFRKQEDCLRLAERMMAVSCTPRFVEVIKG